MNDDDDNHESLTVSNVKILGRGPDAIVRPGCVLVAPSNEFHHFYRQSAIFIFAMGEEERDEGNPYQEPRYIIRGLIIDHPTPFTLAEMMEQNPNVVENPMGQNFLFRGGDKGKDGVILLHDQEDVAPFSEIGDSGIYQGGWDVALEKCRQAEKGEATYAQSFKAFFNYCEFTEQELEDLLDSQEDGDAWVSVEVTPKFVLDPDWDRGDAWKRLRNTLKQMENNWRTVP